MTTYDEILYDVADNVATITLNRPDRLNAWTGTMEKNLRDAIYSAAKDDDVRVIVITGAGRGFCAGADMDGLQQIDGDDSAGEKPAAKTVTSHPSFDNDLGPSVGEHAQSKFGYMFECPKPIIAAINGPCAGIGLVMTLFCDLRFAADTAKFTTAFAQRGLIAEHGSAWLLPRLVGPANALDLLMSARKFTGAEAADLGLVNKAFSSNEFMGEVSNYTKHLVDTVSPRSLTVMKRQIFKSNFQDFSTSTDMADVQMNASFASSDFKEGVAHFVEKRAPNFTGD